MMGEIYSSAQRVNIWLSRSTEAMRVAFEYMQSTTSDKLQFDKASDSKSPILKMSPSYIFRLTSSSEGVAALRDGIYQLASHRYWSRVWTVQDVAWSKNAWIYLTQLETLKLNTYILMLSEVEGYVNLRSEELVKPHVDFLYPVGYKRWCPSIASGAHYYIDDTAINGETLRLIVGKEAEVPLDTIFAYRALLPRSFGHLAVDYERNPEDVLREVTARLIPCLCKLGDSLDIVSMGPVIPNVPSWTLNIVGCGHVFNTCQFLGMFNASKHPSNNHPATHHICSNMEGLHVRGILFDRVALVSDVFPHYELETQAVWHKDVNKMLVEWRNRTQDILDGDFEESMVDALFAAANFVEDLSNGIRQHQTWKPVGHIYSVRSPIFCSGLTNI